MRVDVRRATPLGLLILDSCGAMTTGEGSRTDMVCAMGFLRLLLCVLLLVVRSKYVVQILPSMVVAPVFFKGNMEMGAISQT